MVVAELIKNENGVYTYEYRPWDDRGKGEFTVGSNSELLDIKQLAEDDDVRIYIRQAIAGVREHFRNDGTLPQRAVRVWL